MKLTQEILEAVDNNPGKYFGIGTYKVEISLITSGVTEAGKEYVEFTVVDPEDKDRSGTARLWFTTDGAAKYAISIISGIFVHNTSEDKRDALRSALKKLTDTDGLLDIAQKKLVGKEAYYVVEEDELRTYVNKDGETLPSINRNIYGYEMTPKKTDKVTEKEREEISAGVEEAFPDI